MARNILKRFLCGSHDEVSMRYGRDRKTERLGEQRRFARLQSNMSSKALLLSKMISWRKVQDEGEDDEARDDEDEAIWKKTIIRGGKCRPLNFSGKILYDSDGNLLPDSSNRTPGKMINQP